MKNLGLFSGIGGFELGLEWAGIETVAMCEYDEKAQQVLRKHWPDITIFPDVKELTYEKLKSKGITEIDIITGGFPCQDISVAGKGAGITAPRSGLWKEFARIVGEIRPKYVIVENVSALLHRGLSTVLGDLASIGYDAEWHCIPASAIGAPHRRDRIWIVAYSKSISINELGVFKVEKIIKQELWSKKSRGFNSNNFNSRENRNKWIISKSTICRRNDGLSNQLDQLKQLGNAVVPQIPYLIAKAIMEVEANR